MARLLAMVLAGGRGERLDPLTRDRAKPAVPFGGRYRLVDFVLSNFANSGVLQIKVLTQYKSDSLNTHLTRTWRLSEILGHYVQPVPAQMRTGAEWFKGSADAIYQNLNLITDENPEFVFIFGADQVCRFDVRQMLKFHRESGADCTVAALPVPRAMAPEVGVIEVDAKGRVLGFVEKPKPEAAKTLPGDPARCLASMGNYIFSADALVREIIRDAARADSAHDFGQSIIPEMTAGQKVFAYDFLQNRIPGQTEKERGYWRDVGTIDAYYQANIDLTAIDPVFNLYNEQWPVFGAQHHHAPAKFVFNDPSHDRVGHATDSLISEGCIVSGGHVHKSVLSPRVRINSFSYVEDSILFENVVVGRSARVRRAIVDKNVEIPAGTTIGFNLEEDRRRFFVTEGGVVVIPKGMRVEKGGQ
ncbi:MAG TPA: glucose-1-phosphate adenylyltransferase [Myxococcales bacterium]|jgi:glucose-1-phosphate adenylyltransferase